MKGYLLTTVALLGLLATIAIPAAAGTPVMYNGPTFTVTPTAIAPGGTVNLVLSSGTSASYVAPPSGSITCNPSGGSNCFFPLQACLVGGTFWYQVNQVVVTLPNGTDYMLGSATTSGLTYPAIGRYTTSAGGPAPAINATTGDTLSIPFGPGAAGFYAGSSSLPNPPNNVNPEGAYYWWNTAGSKQSIGAGGNPTSASGKYYVDLEGQVFCGGTITSFTTHLFFDAGRISFTVPEFGAPVAVVAALSILALAIARKSKLGLPTQ